MAKPQISERLSEHRISAQPRLDQRAAEIQAYGTVTTYCPGLEEPVRLEITAQLNQVLADTHDAA